MLNLQNIFMKSVAFVFAIILFAGGINTVEVLAASRSIPAVQMGNNPSMTRDEFMEWKSHMGIRHFNIEGRIYPAGIFFDSAVGESFSYGELRNEILYVTFRPNAVVAVIVNDPVHAQETTPASIVPQNPLDTRSAITLPNRRLTESELAAWIAEYHEMGGATVFELAVVQEINQVREQYGLLPLSLNPALMMSARLKAQEFGDLQYFAHYSPVHGSIIEAARMFGFEGRRASETITRAGRSGEPVFRTTPEGIVNGMLASTRGHREILLNPNAYSVGFGSFFSPNSRGPNGDMSHMFYFATKFGIE